MPNSDNSGRRHSKNCNKSCSTAQKIVIPKGMINPDETTVIEIPSILHKQPVVIAKRKDIPSSSSCGTDSTRTARCKSPRNSSGSFNSFYSASMKDEGPFDSAPIDKNNTMEAGEDKTQNPDGSFSPDFHSTSIQQDQTDLAPDKTLEADAPCGGPRSKSPRNSIQSCHSPRRSSIPEGSQFGINASPNPMQQLAKTLKGDPNLTLDETEEQERTQLQKDLEAFQKARRQLIERTTKFANQLPTGDVYDSFNSTYTNGHSKSSRRNTMIDPRFDQKEYARQLYNTIL